MKRVFANNRLSIGQVTGEITMKRTTFVFLIGFALAILLSAPVRTAFAGGQGSQLSMAQVKSMVEALGYETKELSGTPGKEKYEFKVTRTGYDLPMAIEISPSKNYIWITLFFGKLASETTLNQSQLYKMLSANYIVQPCQYYITDSRNVMLAIAIDNREVSSSVLRRNIDKLADDAVKTADVWKDIP